MTSARTKPFAVWESEYPEECSNLIFAMTEDDARSSYRQMTGELAAGDDEPIPLSVVPLTTEQALVLWRSGNE